MKRNVRALILLSAVQFILAQPGRAISPNESNDFQDGTTGNWSNGNIIGTAPVTNIGTGGPAGAGDRYIQLTADGSASGGKLTAFNRDQWLGDYVALGITSITVDLINQSSVSLSIRMVFKNGPGSGGGAPGYLTQAMLLPVGSGWQHATFSLAPADLIPVNGPAPWSTFFIGEVRFVNEAGTSNLTGSTVVGQMGIDNIRAVPEPATTALFTVAVFVLAALNRLYRPATERAAATRSSRG